MVWTYVQTGFTECILVGQGTGPGHVGMPSNTQNHVALSRSHHLSVFCFLRLLSRYLQGNLRLLHTCRPGWPAHQSWLNMSPQAPQLGFLSSLLLNVWLRQLGLPAAVSEKGRGVMVQCVCRPCRLLAK